MNKKVYVIAEKDKMIDEMFYETLKEAVEEVAGLVHEDGLNVEHFTVLEMSPSKCFKIKIEQKVVEVPLNKR